MKNIALMLFILLFGLSGCGKTPDDKAAGPQTPPEKIPEDFALSLFWFTGAMPDNWMQYSYEVHIGPGMKGRLVYRSGDRSREMDSSFEISDEGLEKLYIFLQENNAFSTDREPGEPIDGGPDFSFVFTAAGNKYGFSELSELADKDRDLAYAIKQQVELLVPAELLDEMNRMQLECES